MSTTGIICSSFFSVITPRTAGFNTLDIGSLTEGGKLLTIILMFIGASPGSTPAESRRQRLPYWRFPLSPHSAAESPPKFSDDGGRMITRKATCIFMLYLSLSLSVSMIIARIENIEFLDALFESVSAIATVGLSTGITPGLLPLSHFLLAF